MKDGDKTKDQLIAELRILHNRLIDLERAEALHKQAEYQIRHRLAIETALAQASRMFVSGTDVDLNQILRVFGEAVAANRAYCFRFREGGRKSDNTHEWCDAKTEPQIENLQDLDMSLFPWWMEKLKRDENILISDVDALPEEANSERMTLQSQKIRSVLVVPIGSGEGGLLGFIGFDDTEKCRVWSNEDVRLLRVASEMVSNYLQRKRTEEALRESEAKYRYLVQHAPVGIYEVDLSNGKFISVNDLMCKYLGYSRGELLAMNVFDTIADELGKQRQAERWTKILAGEAVPETTEYKAKTKDGREIWALVNVRVNREEGKPVTAAVVAFDITERKRAEEALHRSEAKYRELVQNANSIILRFDTQGRITFFNEFAQSFFGYTEDEILGQKVVGTIVPETDTSGHDLAAMITDLLQHPEQYINNENENIRRNGERAWVAWTNKAVLDENGRLAEILCIGNDITDRKRAEEELRTERDMAQKYLDIAGVIFVAIDANQKVTLINKRGCEVLGYREKEIIGKNWFDTFVPEKIRDETKAVFQQLISGKIRSRKYFENLVLTRSGEVLTKSGEEKTIAWHNSLLTDEAGNIIGTLSAGEDITERKRLGVWLR